MAAMFTVSVTITRAPDAGDIKGGGVPRTYTTSMPGLLDQELEFKIPPGAVDQVCVIPQPGTTQAMFFLRSDLPVTVKRNAEVTPQPLGLNGIMLTAGLPNAQPNVTQLLVSNPGTSTATIFVQVAGA